MPSIVLSNGQVVEGDLVVRIDIEFRPRRAPRDGRENTDISRFNLELTRSAHNMRDTLAERFAQILGIRAEQMVRSLRNPGTASPYYTGLLSMHPLHTYIDPHQEFINRHFREETMTMGQVEARYGQEAVREIQERALRQTEQEIRAGAAEADARVAGPIQSTSSTSTEIPEPQVEASPEPTDPGQPGGIA